MSTIVYLSNQQIQFITGTEGKNKVFVKDCFIKEAPEGSIINGIVMDAEAFTDFLKGVWSEKKLPVKDVSIVINSTKFVGKNLEIPKMNDNKMMVYAQREFTDIERNEDRIYGFIPLSGNERKMQQIYAESVSADFIKDYVEIFSSIGVKLKGIYSGESGMISLTQNTEKKGNTYMVQVADKMNLATILFVDGKFYYSNSTRCFYEQGTIEYGNEIARSISQITQFMQAHQVESTLEKLYLAGIDEVDLKVYEDALAQNGINIPIQVYRQISNISVSVGCEVQKYLYAISGLFRYSKWQNFLYGYEILLKKDSNKVKYKKEIIIISSTLVCMLLMFILFVVLKTLKNNELKKLLEYNESNYVTTQVMFYEMENSMNSYLGATKESLLEIGGNIDTYPVGNAYIREIIKKSAKEYVDVKIVSFDSDTGVVNFSATAKDVNDINKYIKSLYAQEIFNKIDYTGYNYESENDAWRINVSCVLAQAAGKEK